jgi:hypothetical protein
MPKMFFSQDNCAGVDLPNGRRYNADRQGFIHVDDASDVKVLKGGGYVIAGGMTPPHAKRYFLCECGWEANINHCPKCDRDDLTRVEK